MKSRGESLEDDSGYPITFYLLKWKGHQNVCSCEGNEQDGLQDAYWDCCLVWNFNLHQRANCKGYLLKLMMLLLFPFHGGQDCGWGNCPCLNICVWLEIPSAFEISRKRSGYFRATSYSLRSTERPILWSVDPFYIMIWDRKSWTFKSMVDMNKHRDDSWQKTSSTRSTAFGWKFPSRSQEENSIHVPLPWVDQNFHPCAFHFIYYISIF